MPRTSTLLYPPRMLAPLRPAATLLFLRDAPQGIEVLMTRRSEKASFAPGAYVFPGGAVDPQDHAQALQYTNVRQKTGSANPLIAARLNQSEQELAWALAAIRESFEELGLLLARDGKRNFDSSLSWVSQEQIKRLNRTADFYSQIQSMGLSLAVEEIHHLAHWVTDRDMPRRFDVPFLIARMPPGQTPIADESEQFAPEWVSPERALLKHKAGEFSMIFPTVRTLKRLRSYATVDAVIKACEKAKTQGGPLWTSCPRAGLLSGAEHRVMEHESAYSELAMVAPYGQIAHELAWQHEKPVRLLKHVARLTAPNPSRMTGPGTNTYIIGTPDSGYVVIDPGPDIPEHIERIMQYTLGEITAIACTHSHPDHSPGAKPLQRRVLEASNSVPAALTAEFAHHMCPILGLASAPSAKDSAQFEPDIPLDGLLQNKELLPQIFKGGVTLFDESDNESEAQQERLIIQLHAVRTPGHAANHLCFILPQDGLLFSGDHILNGSTTVIDPPDGDMSAYLHSLDILAKLCKQHDLRYILPAHGYVLSACEYEVGQDHPLQDAYGGAVRVIAQLKAHRLRREAKVIAAMKALPTGSEKDWLPLVYDDVDTRLLPIAARSLAAHVQRIREHKLV